MIEVAEQKTAAEKAASKPGKMSAGVMTEVPYWLRVQRVGGNLTPEAVSEIMRQADVGLMARLCDLADDARQKDCTLQGILETRENAVAALPWTLVLPENPSRKEKKAAQLVQQVIRSLLPITIPHHNGAVVMGYAVSELGWEKLDGYLIPTSATARRARRFRYAVEDETLLWWDATMSAGIDIRKEFPNRFIISQPRINGSARCREGLVRPLMWAALFRTWSVSDWMKLAELAWKPWRLAKYLKEAFPAEEDIDGLIAILEKVISTGVAVYPDTVDVEVASPGGGASNGTQNGAAHNALTAMLAAEMAKCVLGQTLTTEQGAVGTQALGTVHDDVRKDKRDGDARYLERDHDRDLINPIVLLNFGPDVRPPCLHISTEDKTDLLNFSSGISSLKKSGLRIPTRHVYSETGIPEPKGDEEVLSGGDDAQADPNADGKKPPTPQENPDAEEKPEANA